MTLSKTSWIVKIAYMTDIRSIPDKVDRCTLWERFCGWFVPWLFVNVFLWILVGLLFGILAHLVWRPILFIFNGTKLVYNPYDTGGQEFVIGRNVLAKLFILRYERVDIWWMNWGQIDEYVRSPIVVVIATATFFGFLYLMFMGIPEVFLWVVGIVASSARFVTNTAGFWGVPTLGLIALVALILSMRKSYRLFAATPSGNVIVSHLREWKERHCSIIELQ